MIHDILLSLLCTDINALPIADFLITEMSDLFLHPAEKILLNNILDIGNKKRKLQKFIIQYCGTGEQLQQQQQQQHHHHQELTFKSNDFDIDEPLQKGLYLQAFTDGISIVLQSFTNVIVSLEERYLKTSNFTLLFIYQEINQFELLFNCLLQFVNDIKSQRLHGCALLQYLHKHNLHGNNKILDAIRIIQQSIHIVFFKQLSQWLIYGNFVDEYGEFFIQHIENKNVTSTQTTVNEKTQNSRRDGGGAAAGSTLVGNSNISGTSTTIRHTTSVSSATASVNTELWHYEICYDLLPQYCSTNVAEKILFIGQTVLMFHSDDSDEFMKKSKLWNPNELNDIIQHNNNNNNNIDDIINTTTDFTKNNAHRQSSNHPHHSHQMTSSTKSSLWNNQEYIYLNKFNELQRKMAFNGIQFEQIINEIKCYVTERLSEIAINQADLMKQLRLIKDFYLLGRGELYYEFINQMKLINTISNGNNGGNIHGPTTTDGGSSNNHIIDENAIRDINKAFQNAANSVNIIDDLEQFSIYIPIDDIDVLTTTTTSQIPNNTNNVGQHQQHQQQQQQQKLSLKSSIIYDIIALKYKVKWPLHLLFSPKVIDRYNEMFRFLLRIKKIQYDLNGIWCLHREKQMKKQSQLLQFRNKLIFLIHNLQYYLQVDVLESQFSILANTVQGSKDFEHIQRAHTIFQANVLSLCFLTNGSSNTTNTTGYMNSVVEQQMLMMMMMTTSISTRIGKENPVLTILNNIMLRINQFCEFSLTCTVSDGEELTPKEKLEFETIENLFNNHVDDLLKLLIGVKAGPSCAPLSQLLLRLDYNYWFSSQRPKKL